jgi:hypothetical protein
MSMSKLKRRPSPALTISLIALFVALGSGAYAASKITTSDIQKGAVTGKKIAKDAVKSGKTKNGSLKGKDLKNETITESNIGDQAVTTGKLADQAVTNEKLEHPLLSAAVNANGNLARGQGATTSTRLAQGLYEVGFDRDLSQCTWVSQVSSTNSVPVASGEVSASLRTATQTDALLLIVNNSLGAVADKPFHIVVYC